MSKSISLLLLFCARIGYSQEQPFKMTYDLGLGEPRMTFGTGKLRSASVSLGDVDGDQDIDAVVANGRHWPEKNAVYFNQNGRFTSFSHVGQIHSTSYACELGDMDNDGDLDLVEINDMAPHRLYLNDGKGSFSFHSTISSPSSARNGILADLDNNQLTDIIICNRGQRNTICFNEGNLTFNCEELNTTKNATIDIEVSDLNNDGLPDLVLANRNKIRNSILLNEGERKFKHALDFGSGTFETRSIEIADMNNDGRPDIITGNINGANTIYFGDIDLKYSQTLSFGAEKEDTYSIAVADFNNDGFQDIAAGNYKLPNAVFLSLRGESFERVDLLEGIYKSYDVKTEDLNSDGWIDIAFANSDDFNLYLINSLMSKTKE
ncbi:MAG: VCBS repeat-containing protein [Cyclobacteriaceae bacterium]